MRNRTKSTGLSILKYLISPYLTILTTPLRVNTVHCTNHEANFIANMPSSRAKSTLYSYLRQCSTGPRTVLQHPYSQDPVSNSKKPIEIAHLLKTDSTTNKCLTIYRLPKPMCGGPALPCPAPGRSNPDGAGVTSERARGQTQLARWRLDASSIIITSSRTVAYVVVRGPLEHPVPSKYDSGHSFS
jgi:hypothetical protein